MESSENLKSLKNRFEKNRVGIEEVIQEEFGINLSTSYVNIKLRNPIILAPG